MTPPPYGETTEESLLKLRIHMSIVLKKLEKLENIIPQVTDNTWWINKIKLSLIVVSVSGIALGVIKYAFS